MKKYGFVLYCVYVVCVGCLKEIELFFIVFVDVFVCCIDEWDVLCDEIGDVIGGEGFDRWLIVVFIGDFEWVE